MRAVKRSPYQERGCTEMKKLWTMILSVFAALLLVSGSCMAEGLDAESYVETLCSGDADSLAENYAHTKELLDALKPSGGFAGLQSSLKALGELQSVGVPVISEAAGYTSYSVPCIFSLQKLNLVLNVNSEGQIAGIVTAAYEEGMSEAESDVTETGLPEGITETELGIPVEDHEGWELSGTLTMPEGEGPFPAVILVHGSGPQDRDETIGTNKPFRDIAWGLAEKGIAVYRYDKRTCLYGTDLAGDTGLTLEEETVLDAVKAVEILADQEKIDGTRICVAGHSLGGEALPRIHDALKEQEDVAGYIFLAAPARKLPDMMQEQYDFLYGMTPELTEEQKQEKAQIDAELDRLKNPDTLSDDEAVMGAYAAYWKDLDHYDQVEAAASITQPCFVLQGEEDYQVTMEDFNLWKAAWGEKENWTFKTYEGLTHLFMEGKKENGPADYQKTQTVDPQVIADIASFILENVK